MKRRRSSSMYWLGATGCLMLAAGMYSAESFAAMSVSDAPDVVQIDSLQKYYKPVEFNHTMHTDITSGDCTVCHHQTTGSLLKKAPCINCHNTAKESSTVSCKDCHLAKPFDAAALRKQEKDMNLYHIDKPGLKVAYHLNCLECHKKMGAPVGCQDCHKRTEAGDKLFHADKK